MRTWFYKSFQFGNGLLGEMVSYIDTKYSEFDFQPEVGLLSLISSRKFLFCQISRLNLRNTDSAHFYTRNFILIHLIFDGFLQWSDPKKYSLNSSKTCGGSKNNWLFTEYIGVGETFADFVHVNIEAELTLYGSGTRYRRLLQVYVYRGNNSINIPIATSANGWLLNHTGLLGDFISRYFTPVYTITNTTRPKNVKGRGIVKENQTFPLHFNKTEGVLFGIKSKGACAEILKMKLYYYYCKEKFINSVKFENTTSPLNGSKEVAGNCSDNSSLSKDLTNLKGFCQSNGTWSVNENVKCLCKEGFEPYIWKGCLRKSGSSIGFSEMIAIIIIIIIIIINFNIYSL